METIDRVQDQINAAVILIGHDMGLMAQFVDKVAVMYAGRLVEVSTVREMFTEPEASLCQALISSLPNLENKGVFQGIPGLAPSLLRLPTGCAFHPRCASVMPRCRIERPQSRRMVQGAVSPATSITRRHKEWPICSNCTHVSKTYSRGLINAQVDDCAAGHLADAEGRRTDDHDRGRRKRQRQDDAGDAAAGLHHPHDRRRSSIAARTSPRFRAKTAWPIAARCRRCSRIRLRCSTRSTRSTTC